MIFVGILPYSIIQDKYYFLLGQESQGDDAGKWSGFGGRLEAGESIYQGAAREAYEESMGFLGSEKELLQEINDLNMIADNTFLIYREYDPKLPELYKRVYQYVQGILLVPPEGYLEKKDVRWFTSEEIIGRPDLLRVAFYKSFQKYLLSSSL